jgi:ABC-2 type transport system permease protein
MSTNEKIVQEGRAALNISPLRAFQWSLRRELWEHRAIYLAPMLVATFIAIGLLVSAYRLPQQLRGIAFKELSAQRSLVDLPYSAAAMILIATMVLMGCFYCIEALYAERRDRSILFWKSLPVSDMTTVLAKISVPLLVLPVVTFLLIVCTHLLMLVASSAMLYVTGVELSMLWSRLPLVAMPVGVVYFIVSQTLWFAPIYSWFLFISAWAKRGTFAWALVPPIAIIAIEQVALNSSFFTTLIKTRLVGVVSQAFTVQPTAEGVAMSSDVVPDPGKLFTTPGLWIGLVVAVALLIATARLRRHRDPF